MSTKKLQIINSVLKQAENADTLDGKHADEFAATSDVERLKTLVGDTKVSDQISDATSQYLPLTGGKMTGAIDASGTTNVLQFGTTGYLRGKTASGNTFEFLGLVDSTRCRVGGSYPALELKGKNERPTYNGSNVALQSDIPTRSIVVKPKDQSVISYFKISNFGTWYGLATNEKVSLLIGARSGETILFTLAGENATTMGASALRLNDRHSKILGVYYKISDNAIYVSLAAWANILSVDVLSDKSGNYTPIVEQIDALPTDAADAAVDAKLITVPIIPFGSHYTNGIVIGNTAQNLAFGGKNTRPTYNGNNMALQSDIPTTATQVGADVAGAADTALTNAKAYTDAEITEWIGDKKVSEQITTAIAGKSDTNHNHDTVYAAKNHGNHVPATETANNAKFLRNDNTWQTVTPANIGAAASSHGTHVTFGTEAPKAAGSASVGTATTVSRSDHVHPAQTSITGNAATATKATQDASGNVITSTYATKNELSNISTLVGDKKVSEQIATAIANKQDKISTESWTFTLEDGSTVTKAVYVG